jgi:hypothetical protein
MAPHLRPRNSKVKPDSYATTTATTDDKNPDPLISHVTMSPPPDTTVSTPPIYTIDLSLPPAKRYVKVADDYRHELQNLQSLFDQLLAATRLPTGLVHVLTRLLLRKLHSEEQTQEIRGISQAIRVPMYLLVAYNVLLDLFMGCTSGGARVTSDRSQGSTMVHFRTLDWDMPELRDVVVQFDYVGERGGQVIASAVSYVGFVGVLTAVRKDLSVSLNFRAYHNDDASWRANLKYYAHQVAVLLGFRPSIASMLRDCILPRTRILGNREGQEGRVEVDPLPRYRECDICTGIPLTPSTAAYLIFCTPKEVLVLEKDRVIATILMSSDFLAVTNHDARYDTQPCAAHAAHAKNAMMGIGMEDVIEESVARKQCLSKKWEAWNRDRKRSGRTRAGGVPLQVLKAWMQEYPTCNSQTHFTCLMDPARGTIRWARKYAVGELESEDESNSS